MIKTIKKFEEYSLNIKKYIENSNYKTKYFIKLLQLSNPTFYRKLNNRTFTINEIVKLSEVLFEKEFYRFELEEGIRKGREDVKNGNVSDAKEFLSDIRKQVL